MGKRLLLLMILVGTSLMGWAQNDKFSVTTQMFLNELKGELTFERDTKSEKQLGLKPVEHAMKRKGKNANRLPRDLYLKTGSTLLKVTCDCKSCEMTLTLPDR